MALRQILNVTYAWLVEDRDDHGRATVDAWLAGRPLPPRPQPAEAPIEHGTLDDLMAMAALGGTSRG